MRRRLAALLLMACACTRGAEPADATRTIAPGIRLLPGQLGPERGADGNSVIISGPKGLVVVDGGRGDEHTDALLALIKASGRPLLALVDTHWHLDHIGGNPKLRAAWPKLRIYANPSLDRSLTGFQAEYARLIGDLAPNLPTDSPDRRRYEGDVALLAQGPALVETDRVAQPMTLNRNGRPLEIHVAKHAVTEGDLWLYDRQTRTLIAGDLVTLPVPLLDSACPEGWQTALGELAQVRFATLLPGHGAPMPPAAFTRYRQAYDNLLACGKAGRGAKACADGWFEDAGDLVAPGDEAYGRKLITYYYDSFLKPDAKGRVRWCEAAN